MVVGEHNMGIEHYHKAIATAIGANLPESSLSIFEYMQHQKESTRAYQARPEVKHRRKKKEHEKMRAEKKKDKSLRYKYGKKMEQQEKQQGKEAVTCTNCGMLDHKTCQSKACLANKQHTYHEVFKIDMYSAILSRVEAFVENQKQKKRHKGKKFLIAEDLWKGIMSNTDISLRAASCLDCAVGVFSMMSVCEASLPVSK